MRVEDQNEERFWSKVNKTEGCWLWTACVFHHGYGQFMAIRGSKYAHRYSYELAHGAIPAGMEAHHICKNRACVNPAHLELLSKSDHARLHASIQDRTRFRVPRKNKTLKTHCCHGHELTPENTRVRVSNGWRSCKTCEKQRYQKSNLQPLEHQTF